MDNEKYTLKLEWDDEAVTVGNLTMNGNNYVSASKVNVSGWPASFKLTATNSKGEVTETIEHAKLLQQVKYSWDGGKYYLAFGIVPELELEQKAQNANIQYVAMMAGVDIDIDGGEV